MKLSGNKNTTKGISKPVRKTTQAKQKSDVQPRSGLHNLKTPFGAHKKRKILGRGPGSGHGKTSTRGSKGQTSRAGRHFYLGFEGGQSPLMRRIPKRGFTNKRFKKEYQIVNLSELNKITEATINPEILKLKGLIKDKEKPVKILGQGEIKNPIAVSAHAFSKRASQEIKNSGGKVEIINV
jgi:large subunit ribosomal protein L15